MLHSLSLIEQPINWVLLLGSPSSQSQPGKGYFAKGTAFPELKGGCLVGWTSKGGTIWGRLDGTTAPGGHIFIRARYGFFVVCRPMPEPTWQWHNPALTWIMDDLHRFIWKIWWKSMWLLWIFHCHACQNVYSTNPWFGIPINQEASMCILQSIVISHGIRQSCASWIQTILIWHIRVRLGDAFKSMILFGPAFLIHEWSQFA